MQHAIDRVLVYNEVHHLTLTEYSYRMQHVAKNHGAGQLRSYHAPQQLIAGYERKMVIVLYQVPCLV